MRNREPVSLGERAHSHGRKLHKAISYSFYGLSTAASIYALFVAFSEFLAISRSAETEDVKPLVGAIVLIFIFFGLFFWQTIRAARNARGGRYRSSLIYMHAFHHTLRDVNAAIDSARKKINIQRRAAISNGTAEYYRNLSTGIADGSKKFRKLSSRSIRKFDQNLVVNISSELNAATFLLFDALDYIKSALELISGAPIQVGIKSVETATSPEDDEIKYVARTLIRDRFSEQSLRFVDHVIQFRYLDWIDVNDHYADLTESGNNVWSIRSGTCKEMDRLYPDRQIKTAFTASGMKYPHESVLFSSITRRPFGHDYQTYRRLSLKQRLKATSVRDGKPKVLGVLFASSSIKHVFRRDDVELMHQFSDALFSVLEGLAEIAPYDHENIALARK